MKCIYLLSIGSPSLHEIHSNFFHHGYDGFTPGIYYSAIETLRHIVHNSVRRRSWCKSGLGPESDCREKTFLIWNQFKSKTVLIKKYLKTCLGGICMRCLKASAFNSLISLITASHACGCRAYAAFQSNFFRFFPGNFLRNLAYIWRTQNLWSTPGNSSCNAGSRPCNL